MTGEFSMPRIARSAGYAAAVLLAGVAVLAAPAAAQASAALPGPAVVPCSGSALAAAVQNANSARFAVLRLSRGCNYILTSAATGDDGLPPVTGKIVIIGGHGTQISRSISANPFRILDVAAGGALTLVDVTVANGVITNPNEGAAGIRDAGTLVLRHVRLTGNDSGLDFGGGLSVENGAHATISGSELDGNVTALVGGAIFNDGHLIIDQSTLAGNTATSGSGGAIYTNTGSTTRISRTVVTHNSAQLHGGGIFNTATLVLSGDRVTFNQASLGGGGGISNSSSGTVSLRFTLVTSNTPDNCDPQGTIQGCRN
jgi:predicted outer membrane repeat protein